jgi:hypothetical protein
MANCKVWLQTAGMNLWLTVRECVAAEVGRQYTENPETRVFTLQLPLIGRPKSISVSLNLNFLFCKMRELLILKILPSTKNLHTLHCASWTDAHWSICMRASILFESHTIYAPVTLISEIYRYSSVTQGCTMIMFKN